MAEPKKHHYVPEVYLQRFAINRTGDLYILKVKSTLEKNKPRMANKSQVCYEPNMYRYTNEAFIIANEIEDPNYIEKYSFPYERTELTDLFNKLERRQKLFKTEYKRILQIILSIKKRNPRIRKIFMNGERDEEYIDSRIDGLTREMLKDGMTEEEITTVILKAKSELLEQFKDDEARKDMYKNSILMSNEDFVKNEENALNQILKWSPIVYYTTIQAPFITSDNPGFTMKNGVEIHNTNLAVVDSLVFPVSSTCALQLKRNNIVQDLLLYQKFKIIKASPADVSVINAGTFHNCNEIIICGIEEQLIITAGYN